MASQTKRADYLLLSYFAILLVFGLIMLTSASSPLGHTRFGDSYFFIKRQLLLGVLPGLVAFFFFAKFSYKRLASLSTPIYVGMLALLILVFIPGIGSSLNTAANSWIAVGSYSFQPSEIAKLGIIIFLAAYLSQIGKEIEDLKMGFVPALLLGMVPVALVMLQPDTGTVAILFAIVFALLYFAKARLKHLGGLAALGIGGLILLIAIAPYRAARLTTFLHPELDPQGIGYHINQAFLAIGSGGVLGLGLGHSRQKFQYLPEVHADSIFAVISEEMGLIIALGVVVLIVLIGLRGFVIAKEVRDPFGKLLVAGIITWFMVQSFLNIGAMVGLLPLTGVPLPFVSHGGTALMIAMASVGVLMNVSKEI